jgi:ribonuclease HII
MGRIASDAPLRKPHYKNERRAMRGGRLIVAGIDEVGRGPLAGPVTAAAVILDPRNLPEAVDDSKALSQAEREQAFGTIMARALAVGIGFASPREIDAINIRQATFAAMRRAVGALALQPHHLLVDGNDLPLLHGIPGEAIVGGDAISLSIAAASVIAKVTRDRLMVRLHGRFPHYGFASHKGYATAEHRSALLQHGPSPAHRRSFAPCRGEGLVPIEAS